MTNTDLAVLRPNLAINTLREQIAPEATDLELAYFGQVCNRLNLSPFADQIVLIGRYDSRLKRKVHRHQITVAGRRALAQRTGDLVGIDGPVWCGRREDNGGELVWHEVWDDDDNFPYCARTLVHVRGWPTPANGTVKWSEFAQHNGDGSLANLWKQMPSHMLGKVSESLALRRAFPDVIPAEVADGFADIEGDLPPVHTDTNDPRPAPETSDRPAAASQPQQSAPGREQPNPWERVILTAAERAGLTTSDLEALATRTTGKPLGEAVRDGLAANELVAALRRHAEQQQAAS